MMNHIIDQILKEAHWIKHTSNESFKDFKDPWAIMSPEDRKEANKLFRAAMKAFPSSPKQKAIQEKLQAIFDKYNIGKKA